EVGHRANQICQWRPKRPDRFDETLAFSEGPTVAEYDSYHWKSIGERYQSGIGGQFIGCPATELSIKVQYLARFRYWMDDHPGKQGTNWMQLKLKGGDDAEVAAPTLHTPE